MPAPAGYRRLIYADRMARKMTAPGGARDNSPVRVEQSPALRKIAGPACAVVLAVVVAGTIHQMPGQAPLAIAAAAAALLVTVAGAGWIVLSRNGTVLHSMAGLTAVGLAGAALTGLLPSGTGYLAMADAPSCVSSMAPVLCSSRSRTSVRRTLRRPAS